MIKRFLERSSLALLSSCRSLVFISEYFCSLDQERRSYLDMPQPPLLQLFLLIYSLYVSRNVFISPGIKILFSEAKLSDWNPNPPHHPPPHPIHHLITYSLPRGKIAKEHRFLPRHAFHDFVFQQSRISKNNTGKDRRIHISVGILLAGLFSFSLFPAWEAKPWFWKGGKY